MRAATVLASAVICIPALTGCSGDDAPDRTNQTTSEPAALTSADLCEVLTPEALADLTGATWAEPTVKGDQRGRDDSCVVYSPDTGTMLNVEVWSGHSTLEQDAALFGELWVADDFDDAPVAGWDALTATDHTAGRLRTERYVHVDDRLLAITVQRYDATAPDGTTEDGPVLVDGVTDLLLPT